MEDHHVDRPDVEAQQCVELTGPNRSIGLIERHVPRSGKGKRRSKDVSLEDNTAVMFQCCVLRRPGGHGEGQTPDPIPNSDVKTLCADGTSSQGAGE